MDTAAPHILCNMAQSQDDGRYYHIDRCLPRFRILNIQLLYTYCDQLNVSV